MGSKLKACVLGGLFFLGSLTAPLMAEQLSPHGITKGGQKKIAGLYRIAAIDKFIPAGKPASPAFYRVTFVPVGAQLKGEEGIIFETATLPQALQLGLTFELQADVTALAPKLWEAVQILVWIEKGQGKLKTPVWLLSHKAKKLDLREASYFKMHHHDFEIL